MTPPRRNAAIVGAVMLYAGVLYAGIATVRLYGQVFTRPPAGAASALDVYFAPTELSSASALEDAVLAAKWPADANVVVVADPSLDRQTIYQTYYSTSYVLYPRRVWLISACDGETAEAAIDRYDARFVVSIGRTMILPHAEHRKLSDMFSLIELP
jgi:hypothetical protein